MAVVSIATLKTYFETGDFPTQAQFIDLIDTLGNASQWTTNAQITATQNNYAIGEGRKFRLSTDASRNITGIVAGVDGETKEIVNVGSNQLNIVNQSGSSTAENRVIVDSGLDANIPANGVVELTYDITTARWRLTYASESVSYS